MSSSRDCSPKQRSFTDLTQQHHSSSGKKSSGHTPPPIIGFGPNQPIDELSSVESNSPPIVASGSPTTLSLLNNLSRTSPTNLPPIGSGPSRQRSLRDRLREGITGSFTWQ